MPQDSHKLIITLQKLVVTTEQHMWWPCLIKGEAEIDTSQCETGASTNLMVSMVSMVSMASMVSISR